MKRSIAVVLLLSILAPGVAQADCSQADVAGKSQTYALANITSGGALTISCTLIINALGAVKSGSCTTSLGVDGAVTAGSIKLANAKKCKFTGSFTMSSIEATIDSATLSPNKQILTGTGQIPSLEAVFLLTSTKLPQ